MSEAKIQMRGHCQCCCRVQAVTGGYIAKHGYEVKNRGAGGWFSGVCSGHRFAPVEIERCVLDKVVATIRKQVVELRELADKYVAGTAHPADCKTNRYDHEKREYARVAWNDASDYQRADEIKRAIWNLRQRANAGTSQANTMESIADARHGQPLIEVARDAGPAPISIGEKRVTLRFGTVEAYDVYRGQVQYHDPKGLRRQMSTRAWRALQAA